MGSVNGIFEDDDSIIVKEGDCFCYDLVGCNAGLADRFGDVDCVDLLVVDLGIQSSILGGTFPVDSLKTVSRHFKHWLDTTIGWEKTS